MSFKANTGIIGNKLRQQMYLKHLREVEKINNRQSVQAKNSLKQYQSITQIHKKNKIKAYKFRLSQEKKMIQQKNKNINKKIMSLESQNDMNHNKINYRYWQGGGDTVKTDLHYQYRKRQQQRINLQNKQLMNSIIKQKSTILPQIPKAKSDRNNKSKVSINVSINQTNLL